MKPRIGLALGSGGARGWCHIGILRALAEAGLAPDVICGTSMGALVGAAYASGRLDALEAFALSLTRVSVARLVDVNPASGGLVEGQLIERQLKALGYAPTFEALEKPLIAVASDLFGGTEVWLKSGDLVSAVRASIAIPGIFSPVSHDGKWLMDGGMLNPIPVSACRALGADIVIAVDPNSKLHAFRHRERLSKAPEDKEDKVSFLDAAPAMLRPYLRTLVEYSGITGPKPPNYIEVLSASIDLMTDQIRRSRLAGEPPHVLLSPDLSALSILDFQEAKLAIAAGRRAVEEQADLLAAYA